MKEAIVLYMPDLNKSYRDFFKKNGRKVDTIFLISEQIIEKITDPGFVWQIEKDLRALNALEMLRSVSVQDYAHEFKILTENNLNGFDQVIIPDEDEIVENVLKELYPGIQPVKEKWFIRWGRKTVLSKRAPVPSASISIDVFDREVMDKAFGIAEHSSDWWRQVGVILLPVNGEPISTFNHHLPNQRSPYINGDPRTNFKPGESIEISTAIHAEASAIAHAANKGISLNGGSIYVSTFPCPNCAYLIIESGIKKVYYCEGYSLLNAAELFTQFGVSMIFVDVPN